MHMPESRRIGLPPAVTMHDPPPARSSSRGLGVVKPRERSVDQSLDLVSRMLGSADSVAGHLPGRSITLRHQRSSLRGFLASRGQSVVQETTPQDVDRPCLPIELNTATGRS